MTMGPGGWRASPFAGFGPEGPAGMDADPPLDPPLDPTKGIEVDAPEG